MYNKSEVIFYYISDTSFSVLSAVLFKQLRDSVASLLLSTLCHTQTTHTNDDNEVLKNARDAKDG